MNSFHEANRRHWDHAADYWRSLRDEDGLWRQCVDNPALAFEGETLEQIRHFVGDLAGKEVCVLGSGDNYAAFALAGLGASVTSVDISEKQLAVAAKRATELGLDMAFIRSDAVDVAAHGTEKFDLVVSSNGFYVWISTPETVISAVFHILKPGGFYILYDVHPFQRPWLDQRTPIAMSKPYFKTGPLVDEDDRGETIYEFHWTMGDLLNAMADSGLVLKRLLECEAADSRFWRDHSYRPGADEKLLDWQHNPRAGLPVWLTIAAQRPDVTETARHGLGDRTINQGDIFWIEPETSAAPVLGSYRHPYVVIQEDTLNQSRIDSVVVCALTTNLNQAKSPGNVLLDAGEADLPQRSVAVVSKVSTVKKAWLGDYIGSLAKSRIVQIYAGMRFLQASYFER